MKVKSGNAAIPGGMPPGMAAFPGVLVHFSIIIRNTPPLGRVVKSCSARTVWLGASRSFHCCRIVINASRASIMAKLLPMQTRGPPPKGR